MTGNIIYRTDRIAAFYAVNRQRWDQLYLSEKMAFRHAAGNTGSLGRLLDVGCAVGGLCRALHQGLALSEYVGVDINAQAIQAAAAAPPFPVPSRLVCADILDRPAAISGVYDAVVSLSCADWNVETKKILAACWDYVAPGGTFIVTLRLTNAATVADIQRSFQYICFGSQMPEQTECLEKAAYVVFNVNDALRRITGLSPEPVRLFGYGYWGKPSMSAVTCFERLMFTALAVKKPAAGETVDQTMAELNWPCDILIGQQ